MQAKIKIRKAPLIVSCIQSYISSIYSFIHPLYSPLPRQSSCQCLHPESSHLCRYLSNPTTHRCASAASAHQISIAEFINFLEFVYAFFPGPGPNVVNLTFRLTRKRGSYFLQIYLSKDLTKPPKSEVASRPCQSRGCSQRREPLTALQGGQSYESNQHLQKHYSIHP